jgi:GR25 family glycosyltransferase involved in LPS biosynthesis
MTFIWDFLEKYNIDVWCICLKERDDRHTYITNEFKRIGLIDKVNWHRPEKCKDGGRIGCFNSHKYCMITSLNKNKHALVFEDDVVFTNDCLEKIKYINKFLCSNRQWDILKLGSTITYISHSTHILNIYKCKSLATHAIIYNSSFIINCINDELFTPKLNKLHIDEYFLYSNANEYNIINPICYQNNLVSDNRWDDDSICYQKIWQSKYTLIFQKIQNTQKKICRFLPIYIQKNINVAHWVCLFISKCVQIFYYLFKYKT